jgi:uncharacterized ParB-like nuclease family protein
VINAQVSSPMSTARLQPRLWRPGSRLFWVLLGAEGALVLAALLTIVSLLPAPTPLTRLDSAEKVRAYVLTGDRSRDPLLEIVPGVVERSSALRGLKIDGQTYYYYFEGRRSYDPLSRGALREDQIERVLRDDGGATPLVIYRALH